MNKGDLKIERLQQYLDRQKGVVESNIKEYNQQLEKNYLYLFGWHADDLYKAYYMNQHYKAIQENLDNAETPQNIGEFLKRCISYMEDDLLQGQLVKRSTSPMSNIAHSLEMECKQKLLKDFQNLNKILQSETVGERIRPQESTKREITPAKEKKKTGPRLR